MTPSAPARGEVWLIDFSPTRGHEQAGLRPGIVISTTFFNQGPAELMVVLPLTTTRRNIPMHVEVDPPEGGVRRSSFIMCENIRSAARERLMERWGIVAPRTLAAVEDRLRILLEL